MARTLSMRHNMRVAWASDNVEAGEDARGEADEEKSRSARHVNDLGSTRSNNP